MPSKTKRPDSGLSRKLFSAAATGDAKAVKQLLAAGADANAAGGEDGGTPLYGAAVGSKPGHLEAVEALIAAGADVNFGGAELVSPLVRALTENRTAIAAVLARAGAKVVLPAWLKKQSPEAEASYKELAQRAAGKPPAKVDASKTNQKTALDALAEHQKSYGRKIGKKLREFWSTDPWRYEAARLDASVPGIKQKLWRLALVPPAWSALSDLFDDAVVGQHGDWKQAGDVVPLFQAGDEGLIVTAVAAPHWVGWFAEAHHQRDGKGYRTGVFELADSLEVFLGRLDVAKKRSAPAHDAWSSAR